MELHDIFNTVKESAELASDTLRIRYELHCATDQLAVLIRKLGSAVYEEHLSKKPKTKKINLILEAIDEKRAEMDILYAELYALNGKVECDSCHAVVSIDCDYCPKCGTRIFYEYDDAANEDGKENADAPQTETDSRA